MIYTEKKRKITQISISRVFTSGNRKGSVEIESPESGKWD